MNPFNPSVARDIAHQVGIMMLAMIEQNIRAGHDADGKPYAYSTRPFVMPAGRFAKLTKKDKHSLHEDARLTFFMTKARKLWVLVHKGYRDLRAIRGRSPSGDFLQDTGAMMRNMSVIRHDEYSATIGFLSPKEAQKALWLNVLGAGKSRKVWKFLGITREQQQALAEHAARLYAQAGLSFSGLNIPGVSMKR